jgi:hypothetical protein
VTTPLVLTAIALLDELLSEHRAALGRDFTGYGNHTYRVVNFCAALSSSEPAQIEKIAIAAAFHDLGIWTHGTFDYLAPSIELARGWLEGRGKGRWNAEISAMIREHHKISRFRGEADGGLIERFRRADWIDVTRGLVTFGLPRSFLREVLATWPSAGFHRRLVELQLTRLRTHPWSPLPMMRL